jgi:uncharacterized membrane protein YozB (DUF420 family)
MNRARVAARARVAKSRWDILRAVIDAKLAFWTAALANMLAIVVLAAVGVRRVRRKDVAGHRRAMATAAGLVLLFLVAYGIKVAALGREQLELWAPHYVWALRFHELCVLGMVAGGARALWLGERTGFRDGARARSHRIAGRTAAVSALLGVLSAGYVLFGMYARGS